MEIPTGYAAITFGMTSSGDPDDMVSTWGVSITDDSALADDLKSMCEAWTLAMAASVSTNITQTIHRLYQSPADGGDIVEVVPDDAAFGVDGGNVYANNCAYIIKKTCGVGGRKHRGRIFVPGVVVSNVNDDGTVANSEITGFNSAAVTFLESFPHGGIGAYFLLHDDALVPPDAVLQLTMSRRLATMRHRYQN